MVMQINYRESAYLNHGEYKPCVDSTIGELIIYLQQFPKNWPISIGSENRTEPVLIDADIATVLTMIGPEVEF